MKPLISFGFSHTGTTLKAGNINKTHTYTYTYRSITISHIQVLFCVHFETLFTVTACIRTQYCTYFTISTETSFSYKFRMV